MTVRDVFSLYSLGTPLRVRRLTEGLVHDSYKVDTKDGSYVLQRLHPQLSALGITEDFADVCRFLREQGVISPQVVSDKKRRIHILDGDRAWRLLTFVSGAFVKGIPTLDQLRRLGSALGQFHLVMRKYPFRLCSPLRLHETESVFSRFNKTISAFRSDSFYPSLSQEADVISDNLPKLFLPKSLPRQIIHGDPKTSNFVFMKDGTVAFIDLDTCTTHTPLADLGDALGGDAMVGSWCSTRGSKPKVRVSAFRAALQGHYGAMGSSFTQEKQYLVQAVKLIVLELAARFFIDCFEDSYFHWDNVVYPSRRAHNAARVRAQVYFYNDLVRKEGSLRSI